MSETGTSDKTMSEKDCLDPVEFADLFGQIFDCGDRPPRVEVRPAEPKLSDEPEPSSSWGTVVLLAIAGGLLILLALAWEVLLPLAFLMGWWMLNIWVMLSRLD